MKIIQNMTLAGAVALGALSAAGAASAADLAAKPYVKAPVAAPVYSWTGFYVGGHVGAGWGTTETDANIGAAAAGLGFPGIALILPIGQTQMNGFLGGAHGGYNWQSGVMVYGIEGDINGAGIKGHTVCLIALNCNAEVKWMADITGRIGVTVGDRGLVYIKGGAAWAGSKYSANQNVTVAVLGLAAAGSLTGAVDTTRFGGTLGAGVEYGFAPGWSVKLEYDYFDFGKANYSMPVTAAGALGGLGLAPLAAATKFNLPITVGQQVHTVTIGASYHFNEPVVARY